MPGFDVDAARKAGYSDDEILKHLTESRKFDISGALQSGYSKSDIIQHLASTSASQPSAAAPQESWLMRGTREFGAGTGQEMLAVKDLLAGVGSGVLSTIFHGGDLVRRMTGQERIIDTPEVQAAITAPQTPMGQAGKFIEQSAEYLIPGAGAARGAALLRNAPRAAQILGRAGLEAAGAAGTAALQSGGDPETIRNAAISGGVVGGATAAAPMAVPLLREAAVRQYSRVLNPTKEKTKAITQRIVPELIERREWAATLPRLLNRAQDRMRYFGQQIDDVWSQMEQQGTTAQVAPILQRLDDVAREHFYVQNAQGQLTQLRGPAERGLRELEGIGQTILDASTINPINGQAEVPVATLRALRQYWDEVADKSGAFTKNTRDLADWAAGRAHRYAGDAVRAELAQARPDLSRLNQEFSFWNRVSDVVEQTVGRRTGQQKPLTRQLMRAAGIGAGTTAGASFGGAMGGGIGAVLGGAGMEALQTLISSPGWGTVTAVTKDRLANAIVQGHRGQIEFYLAQALKAAGMGALTRPTESGAKTLAPATAR